jgi:hypothetical protein
LAISSSHYSDQRIDIAAAVASSKRLRNRWRRCQPVLQPNFIITTTSIIVITIIDIALRRAITVHRKSLSRTKQPVVVRLQSANTIIAIQVPRLHSKHYNISMWLILVS